MSKICGTQLDARFINVVDGDTIRVQLPGADSDTEKLRILCLDTEESFGGGSKPETTMGHRAKERAIQFFERASSVTLEFPGGEPLEVCIQKYRGNYGRLLVFVHLNDVDYQEVMIKEGFSPYFTKYGNAAFPYHHDRYQRAERRAQIDHVGIWDQIGNNRAELRNYAALGTWWQIRAVAVDRYRELKIRHPSLLNSRLDYAEISQLAQERRSATVFTEMRAIQEVGSRSGLIRIGSNEQRFSLFIPNLDSEDGRQIANLANNRYISAGENHPRQSYLYVTGELSQYRGDPQMILNTPDQLTDTPSI